MATVVSTPVSVWVASIMAGTSVSANGSITATFNLTAGFEIQIPIRIVHSRTSNDVQCTLYRTLDGAGTNYDTTGMAAFSVARIATGTAQASIVLPTGQYALRVDAFTSQDAITVQILTQMVVSAIQNV